MAIYRLTVEKYMASIQEYWSNVYHVASDSGLTAGAVGGQIVAAEIQMYPSSVLITKVSVDEVGRDDVYDQPQVFNVTGTRILGSELMPLFVCGRVDLTYQNSRPGRKYLRAVLEERDTSITSIGGDSRGSLQTYLDRLLQIDGLCDADGNPLTGGAVFTAPAMRQLRRGSKKKRTP